MLAWGFWSYVVQGLLVSLGTSAAVGTWTQVVTRRRHRERLQAQARQHAELMVAVGRRG